uniref:(California timema) hypothetical protein n=1 Tax=Timema californicum TaxID=61474 RepID=A0A7R9P330_TIMCA|nr:unnamed protein product [Timema californicum]
MPPDLGRMPICMPQSESIETSLPSINARHFIAVEDFARERCRLVFRIVNRGCTSNCQSRREVFGCRPRDCPRGKLGALNCMNHFACPPPECWPRSIGWVRCTATILGDDYTGTNRAAPLSFKELCKVCRLSNNNNRQYVEQDI